MRTYENPFQELEVLGEQMPEVVTGVVQDCGQGSQKPLEPEVSE